VDGTDFEVYHYALGAQRLQTDCAAKPTHPRSAIMGGGPYPPHPGTRFDRYRCSLPGLTGFTANRRGGTGTSHHKNIVRGGCVKQPGMADVGILSNHRVQMGAGRARRGDEQDGRCLRTGSILVAVAGPDKDRPACAGPATKTQRINKKPALAAPEQEPH